MPNPFGLKPPSLHYNWPKTICCIATNQKFSLGRYGKTCMFRAHGPGAWLMLKCLANLPESCLCVIDWSSSQWPARFPGSSFGTGLYRGLVPPRVLCETSAGQRAKYASHGPGQVVRTAPKIHKQVHTSDESIWLQCWETVTQHYYPLTHDSRIIWQV